MNTETGQITNDPELIRKWCEAGVRVLDLPDYAAEQAAYFTDPVAPEPPKPAAPPNRHRNTTLLRMLAGRR